MNLKRGVIIAAFLTAAHASAAGTESIEHSGIEARLFDCLAHCSVAADRYTAIMLLDSIRLDADSLAVLNKFVDDTTDPLSRLLATFVLYRKEPNSEVRAKAFVSAISSKGVSGRLWTLATEETKYFTIIDFWRSLSHITIDFRNPQALDILFKMASESDGGESEAIFSAIANILVVDPKMSVELMDKIHADKNVLGLVLSSALSKADASKLRRILEDDSSGSPYRTFILEHL